MPAAARLTDKANCPSDSHGNICCSHNVTGPAIDGSPDVNINGLKALVTQEDIQLVVVLTRGIVLRVAQLYL